MTRYELHLGLEPVSKGKLKVRKCRDSKEKPQGGWIPPAEIGLDCCKELYTVRKRLVDFSLLINFTVRKLIFIVPGDWGNLTGDINIFDLCLPLKGQMPKQSLRYFPVPHPTHLSFFVMYFSVINMWLLSNCFILLHSSAKLTLGHQEANNRQYPINK